jgi:hypothetical protein
MKRELLAAAVPLAMAACANRPPHAPPEVPDRLKPADREVVLRTVYAAGTQIYECRVSRSNPLQLEWVFIAPEADLLDDDGKRIGRHLQGPLWQHNDGSEVIGTIKAVVDAPRDEALPWLLLKTRSVGGNGAFAKVTSIQRINTVGGTPPATMYCTPRLIGTRAIVPYNADYVMFGER